MAIIELVLNIAGVSAEFRQERLRILVSFGSETVQHAGLTLVPTSLAPKTGSSSKTVKIW